MTFINLFFLLEKTLPLSHWIIDIRRKHLQKNNSNKKFKLTLITNIKLSFIHFYITMR